MQAAVRTKLNFTGYDQNPSEFDYLEANSGGLAGSFSARNPARPPEYASHLSFVAPRVVTGQSAFPIPSKAPQTGIARSTHSKYGRQKALARNFGWADNFSDRRGLAYAVGVWALFLAIFLMRVR